MTSCENWKHSLDISDLHDAFENNSMTISQVAKHVADRLDETPYHKDWQLMDIADRFRVLAKHADNDVEEYDNIMEDLYNWADRGKRLWVVAL